MLKMNFKVRKATKNKNCFYSLQGFLKNIKQRKKMYRQ